jgi:uncharacterized caspase-like protein
VLLAVGVCLTAAALFCGCGDLLTGDTDSGRRNFAVIVGIADYQAATLNLKWADDDALDFYDALRRGKNWETDKITLLTNSGATKEAIKGALASLSKRATADDQIVFYFSGRGTNGPDQPPFDEGDGLDEYLMPYDSDPASPARDINDDELEALFAALPTNNVMIVLDTSFGAPGRTNPPGKEKGFVRGRSTPRGLDGMNKELARPGYVFLTASLPGEAAYESNQLRKGVFSSFLSEGLRGAANPGRKFVTALQAFEYAAARTSGQAPGQSPQLIDNRGKAFKISLF